MNTTGERLLNVRQIALALPLGRGSLAPRNCGTTPTPVQGQQDHAVRKPERGAGPRCGHQVTEQE